MAEIKKITYTDSLRQGADKINSNFVAVVDGIKTVDDRVDTIIVGGGPDKDPELVDVRNLDPSYTAQREINVAGDVTRDMQAQLTSNKNELEDVRTVDPSYTPRRTINTAGDVTRDMQEQFVGHKSSTVTGLYNLAANKLPTETDYTAAFQRGLNIARDHGSVHIYIPAGEYEITDMLRIYANTAIEMDKNAVLVRNGPFLRLFINGEYGNDNYASGYDGDGDIVIRGGTIDLKGDTYQPTDPTDYGPVALSFGHADGIVIENLKITNGYNNHYIEVNGCRNVRISGCVFTNHITTGTRKYELVQIDFATSGGFPVFGEYDETGCDNVLIEGCLFQNFQSAVGTHRSISGKWHHNIRIIGNHFEHGDIGIIGECFANTVIDGNTFRNLTTRAVAMYGCRDAVIGHNKISMITEGSGIRLDDTNTNRTTRVIINGNNIFDAVVGVQAVNTDHVIIDGNEIFACKNEGVYLEDVNVGKISNNMVIGTNLSDNNNAAIWVRNSHKCEVIHNTISNDGYETSYSYAIRITSPSSDTVYDRNIMNAGTLGIVEDTGTRTVSNGKVFLTGNISVSSGAVELLDDITKYDKILIATGVVSSGGVRTSVARGWFKDGFRPGTDWINVATNNGKFIASVDTPTQITITQADDPLRYIIGVKW